MTTPSSILEPIIRETIALSATPVSLEQLYAAVDAQVNFDTDDHRSPIHKGKPTNEPSWKRNVRNVLQKAKQSGELVNESHDNWRLPSPNPSLTLDVAGGWDLVRRSARDAKRAGTSWKTAIQGHHYSIQSVEPGIIRLDRLDGTEIETLSRSEVERGMVFLNAAGGRLGRRTIHYTVAKEQALVFLHPNLSWDAAGEWIEVKIGGKDQAQDKDALDEPPEASQTITEAPDDDSAEKQLKARADRKGQGKFRDNLMRVYGGRCCITGVAIPEVLDACHIEPHAHAGVNHSTNGLLLRADLHDLFDSDLIGIHPEALEVHVDPRLASTEYGELAGKVLSTRTDCIGPDKTKLEARWARFVERLNETADSIPSHLAE
jgi:hypothetical protein